jgi:4-diphosphocytidyl-2-C-methyl-D-erythritol kinase
MPDIRSPAKINLFLKALRKRKDGYHDILSVMCGVTIFDHMTLSFDVSSIRAECSDPRVPEDSSNLACKAASLFMKRYGTSDGVRITIRKTIPVAAGLGGGSSNAASVLMGLNRRYDNPFSNESLMSMAGKIGADVPFFIFRSPAMASGIGDKLVGLGCLPPFWLVVIDPGLEVSTAWVYENLELTNSEIDSNIPTSIKAVSELAQLLHNDLEKVTFQKYPVLEIIKGVLIDNGAQGALMSGSGPAVFGIFDTINSAKTACRSIRSRQGKWNVFLAKPLLT